jgi:hypothetical protein
MVTVPFFASSSIALERNSAFFYFQDHFQRPNPCRPDVAVSIDGVFDKLGVMDARASRMHEGKPFMLARSSGRPELVPDDPRARREWLARI